MKISLNLIRYYGCTDSTELTDVDKLVEKIGAQLGAVEEVSDLGKKYEGIVVAKVVSCVEHNDSDHLHVCKVDDGGKVQNVERDENGHVQVVCGAPNVREGLTVAWLPPGVTVPSTVGKDPLILEVRDIRGQKSNGMLASAHELGISNDHDGILEINEADAKPGDDFAKVYQLDDHIVDIENKMFTHRPDCFGQLGVAREIAGIQGQQFTSPDWYITPKIPDNNPSEIMKAYGVTNEIPELCPRYMLIGMENITIAPSPIWLQTYLSRVGIRPINNIVDMTNYMMILTGQPLHAFDFDKVAKDGNAQIVVRKPHQGEKMTLLDGKEITLRADAILICDSEKPIALGGMMGGNNSEIDEHTTRILIECASFDMYNIRRSSMEHGIFTDAVTRFTKGQATEQCPVVLYKAVQMTQELCATAKPVGEAADSYPSPKKNQQVTVMSGFINARLGLQLSVQEMTQLLTNVEFHVETSDDQLNVLAPFWRTDIEIPEDIVEEIGRLYGYDHLPLELPKRDLTPAPKDSLLELKAKLRSQLSRAGANEVLTYSFAHGNLLEKAGQNKALAFQLSNALSPDLQYYRLSLTPSLLDKVHANIKAGYNSFALFELGKAHYLGEMDANEPQVPNEDNHVALVIAFDDKQQPEGALYYYARRYLEQIVDTKHITLRPLSDFDLTKDEWGRQLTAPYELARSAVIVKDNQIWGVIGEFKVSVRQALKLPAFTAGFEVHADAISERALPYNPLPRFPKVEQDICLKVPGDMSYQELADFIQQQIDAAKPEQTHFTFSPVDIYRRDDNPNYKQITFHVAIASYEKTLRDAEVNALLDQAASAAKEKFGAERI